MLVLTRKPDEAVLIGDDIEVRVLAVRGNSVRLGIAAPMELAVDREEIRQSKLNDARRDT